MGQSFLLAFLLALMIALGAQTLLAQTFPADNPLLTDNDTAVDLSDITQRFETETFRPEEWQPEYPNPAFSNMRDDGYRSAKIVMAFTDDDIRAIVKTGELSDPEAEGYLIRTLISRRDKIGRHLGVWLVVVTGIVRERV